MLAIAISMIANIHQTVDENICLAQEKQRRYYNRRYQVPNKIRILKGKKRCQMKLQRLEKVRVWAFWLLVHHINYL